MIMLCTRIFAVLFHVAVVPTFLLWIVAGVSNMGLEVDAGQVGERVLATSLIGNANLCAKGCVQACVGNPKVKKCSNNFIKTRCKKFSTAKFKTVAKKCRLGVACTGGRRCSDKTCAMPGTCCASEKLCSNGSCIEAGQCCPGERDCGNNSTCASPGTCCPTETKCDDGSCKAPGQSCGGQNCSDGTPRPPTGCCTDEKMCSDESCVVADSCCSDQILCNNGTCVEFNSTCTEGVNFQLPYCDLDVFLNVSNTCLANTTDVNVTACKACRDGIAFGSGGCVDYCDKIATCPCGECKALVSGFLFCNGLNFNCTCDVSPPTITMQGLSEFGFNPTGSQEVCFSIDKDAFVQGDVSLSVNYDAAVEASFETTKACFSTDIVDGANNLIFEAHPSVYAGSLDFEATIWAGSSDVQVELQYENGTTFVKNGSIVKARLVDYEDILTSKEASTGIAAFENVPLGVTAVQFVAIGPQYELGSSVVLSGTSISLTMSGLHEPSAVDNNDLSKGTEGWELATGTYFGSVVAVQHVEDVGPQSERRMQSNNDLDLVVFTNGEFYPQQVSRTFETKPGTTGINVRYRFVTTEFPYWFGSQFDDYFHVVLRSNAGDALDVQKSMNGLGYNAFDAGGSTQWFEANMKLDADGDTVQLDATVSNVGDDFLDSALFIDYINETQQVLCIYSSRAEGDDGPVDPDRYHAVIAMSDTSTSPPTVTSWGLYPSFSHGGRTTPGTDVRTNFPLDRWSASVYPYIYCEPISNKAKDKLFAAVSRSWYYLGLQNCASFASDVFYDVTGIDVDADSVLGIELPQEIGEHIKELNGGRNAPEDVRRYFN